MRTITDQVQLKIKNQDYLVEYVANHGYDNYYSDDFFEFESLNVYKVNDDLTETKVDLEYNKSLESIVINRLIEMLR